MSNDFAQLDRIADRLIQNVPFFKGLNKADFFSLLGKARRNNYSPGEAIFSENDAATDTLYIIMSGKVDILKTTAGAATETIDSLGVGNCFGEMALIDNQPRSATVIARQPTLCLACTAEAIESVQGVAINLYGNLARIIAGRQLEIDKQLHMHLKPQCIDECIAKITQNMPALTSEMSSRALSKLAEIGDAYRVAANNYVVKANTQGQYMFVVMEGELEVRKTTDSNITVLGTLRHGSYFGEIALVSPDQGRMADVFALTEAQLIRLSANHLQKTPEIGAPVYRELARIFSMRLRRATRIYSETVARNCQGDCEWLHRT